MTGETIAHYHVLEKLGEGGMGVVYKATDEKLKRTVALKFLRSEAFENVEAKSRFVHEAQVAASLDHPNVCTVHEINEEDGEIFIAMAYVDGVSLKERLQDGALAIEEVIHIAIQTAEGLGAAHRHLVDGCVSLSDVDG